MAHALMKNSSFRLAQGEPLVTWCGRPSLVDKAGRRTLLTFTLLSSGGAYALDKHLLEAVRQLPRSG